MLRRADGARADLLITADPLDVCDWAVDFVLRRVQVTGEHGGKGGALIACIDRSQRTSYTVTLLALTTGMSASSATAADALDLERRIFAILSPTVVGW